MPVKCCPSYFPHYPELSTDILTHVHTEKKNTLSFTVPEIVALKQLAYGVSDNNCTLEQGEIGQCTILYDPACIGRGKCTTHIIL